MLSWTQKIKSFYWISIIIILLTAGAVISSSWIIINNVNSRSLKISQTNMIELFVKNINIVLTQVTPALIFVEEFMKIFTVANVTLEMYIKLSSVNSSSVSDYLFNIKAQYNISQNQRAKFEEDASISLSIENFTIKDILLNQSMITAPTRLWYCPVTFVSPLNDSTVYFPGVDICNVDTFKAALYKIQNSSLQFIFGQPRIQIFTKISVIDFLKRTENGFASISLDIRSILYLPKINSGITSVLYFNNQRIYDTCSADCLPDNTWISKNLTLPDSKDFMSIAIFFDNNTVNHTLFFYILLIICVIIIILISGIIQLALKARRFEIANMMLGYVNHEIRNPLNCIKGMIEITLMSCEENTEIFSEETILNLNSARNACNLLNHIVNDILDIQKITEKKLLIVNTFFNIKSLEKTLYSIIKIKLESNPKLKYFFENQSGLLDLYADESRIVQILINFLTNSIKFTDFGDIRVDLTQENEMVVFSVTDTGRGIEDSDKSKIFEPFVQTGLIDSLRHGGVGLGLNLCDTLIKLMNGSIGFESKIKIGSKFWFKIPLQIPDSDKLV